MCIYYFNWNLIYIYMYFKFQGSNSSWWRGWGVTVTGIGWVVWKGSLWSGHDWSKRHRGHQGDGTRESLWTGDGEVANISPEQGAYGSVGCQTRLVPCSPRRPGPIFGPFSQAPCRPPGSSSCSPAGPSSLISTPTQILTKACKKHSQDLIKSHTGMCTGGSEFSFQTS